MHRWRAVALARHLHIALPTAATWQDEPPRQASLSVHGLTTTIMKRCGSALASGIAFGQNVDAHSCARSDSDAARFHAVA